MVRYQSTDPSIAEFSSQIELERGQSARTAEEYSRDVELFGRFLEGQLPEPDAKQVPKNDRAPAASFTMLGDATASDIRRFVVELMGKRGYSAVAVRRKLAALRAFYALQKREGRRGDNPALDVPPPKAPRRLPNVLSQDDVGTILRTRIAGQNDFERTRNAAILGLFYASGIRRAELVGLNLADVDLETRRLRVIGKGDKQRTVFINAATVALLSQYLVHRPRTADEALFVGKQRRASLPGRLSSGYVGQLFQVFVRISGLTKHATPHMLRHSFATHLLENGADIVTIKELLGHESLSTTQIYVNLSMEHMRKTYEGAHPMDRMSDEGKL
jgi:integrase/recombinase XerC